MGDFRRKRNRSFFQIFRRNRKDFPFTHYRSDPDPDGYRDYQDYRDSRSLSVSPAGLVLNEELYGIRLFDA